MQLERLKWIAKAIEYDRLTNKESAFLFKCIEDFLAGKLMAKTTEERLEAIFAEVQWREDDKESVPVISAILNEESAPGALS